MITQERRTGAGREGAKERELLCTADATGHLTSVNADWQRVLGWTADELTSRPLVDFVHPSDRPQIAEAITRAMKPGGEPVEIEPRFRSRGGRWRWLRIRIQNDGDSWLARASDVTDDHEAEEQLRGALSADRLVAHRQPIVESGSRALVQEELLVRMRAPEDPRRILPPADFLPRAERLGLVSLVDRRMVSLGLEMATRGRRAAVNLSARSIPDPSFMAEVEHAVQYVGPYAANLVFEITETAALDHLDAAAGFAQRLSALGVGFALDDFGTGLGSFTDLRALPIQFLKIDALFVQNALASQRDRAMVSGIVALARQLGIRTVAEGIEDAGMLELMGACGVDYAQGFFLGAPAPPEARANARTGTYGRASTPDGQASTGVRGRGPRLDTAPGDPQAAAFPCRTRSGGRGTCGRRGPRAQRSARRHLVGAAAAPRSSRRTRGRGADRELRAPGCVRRPAQLEAALRGSASEGHRFARD